MSKIDELRIVKFGVFQKLKELPLKELLNICPDTLYIYCWGGGGAEWGCHPVRPTPPPKGHDWHQGPRGIITCHKCKQSTAMFNKADRKATIWETYWKLYGLNEAEEPEDRPDVTPCEVIAMDEALK